MNSYYRLITHRYARMYLNNRTYMLRINHGSYLSLERLLPKLEIGRHIRLLVRIHRRFN